MESTVICIDNSEWMRNGDMAPTRLQCEQDAANLILQCKLRANPENGVGLISMADRVDVLSTMTREDRKLFVKLHEVEVHGSAQLVNAIKVAHLALRHRQNRHHRMRIIVFIGSPIEEIDESEFTKLAKKLKKEKVNVDFVCFGEATDEANAVLSNFVDILNGNENNASNILVVSAGSKLVDALISSPICRSEDGANMAVIGNGGGFEFGIDPADDPELALALRVSLEEQRQRQRMEGDGMDVQPPDNNNPDVDSAPDAHMPMAEELDPSGMSEEEQLQWALRMSMVDSTVQQAGQGTSDNNVETMQEDPSVGQLINNPELLQQIVDDMSTEETKKENNKKEGEGSSK